MKWLTVFASVCLCGCQRDSSVKPPSNVFDADEVEAEQERDVLRVSLGVADLAEQPIDTRQIPSGSDFLIRGTFHLRPSGIPNRPVLQIVGRQRDGQPITLDSTVSETKPTEDGGFSYHGTVTAPEKAGEYQIQAYFRGQLMAEESVAVK